MNVTMTVNGETRTADVEPRVLLVHLLRDGCGGAGAQQAGDAVGAPGQGERVEVGAGGARPTVAG